MMKAKLKKLDESLQALGLNKEEVFSCWLKEKGFTLDDLEGLKKQKQIKSETFVAKKGWRDYPIINPKFNDDDIRSRVQIGWYAFAGGRFSPDKDAYSHCQGVIGIINDDLTAKEGKRVKVVLRHPKKLHWCSEEIYTDVTNGYDGRANTRNLLEFGKNEGISFPAMEYAFNYAFDGVKAGEAYVPAKNELIELFDNWKIIDRSLKQIGSPLDDCNWSSSEFTDILAVAANFILCYGDYGIKGKRYSVRCFLNY